ncbi:hypothetical protein N7533_002013 [Penicillium manginii]|jgi:hypothetical protein|uniref:uncharacterized protein n=1 Tax=Penicillium manginii TaxID=203109 RepID=UPI002548E90A|nr:uncharacterized protein N7533_002013 [Penicillium manginii]KAJ5763332.1 hypothetical protein N7533_002013 [Penicillium manginii]
MLSTPILAMAKIILALFTLIATAAMTYNFRLTGHFLPIHAGDNIFYKRPPEVRVYPDPGPKSETASSSCWRPASTERVTFSRRGCTVYGYPSTGGILIKEAPSILDMIFLSLPRDRASERSADAGEEDCFCGLLQRVGARFWGRREDWVEGVFGLRFRDGVPVEEVGEKEERVLVFGWPEDGVGVWVLRFESEEQLPRDFGRVDFAVDMGEKIGIMREYGALFFEDVGIVEDLYGAGDRVGGSEDFGTGGIGMGTSGHEL